MSLIDEALRKARLEAAQKDAERRGHPSPAASSGLPGRPAWRRSRRGPLTAGVIAAVVLVAISLAAGMYLGRRPGGVAVSDDSGSTPVAAGVTAPAAAGAGAQAGPATVPPANGPSPAVSAAAASPGAEPGGAEAAATDGVRDREASPAAGPPAGAPRLPAATEREAPDTPAGSRGESPLETDSSTPEPSESGVAAGPQPATPPAQPPGTEPLQAPQNPPSSTAGVPAPGSSPSRKPASSAAHLDADGGPVYRREAPTASGGKLALSGIAWRETDPVAVLNGEILGVGEGTAGYSITGIERDRVHLRGPEGGTITIYLP